MFPKKSNKHSALFSLFLPNTSSRSSTFFWGVLTTCVFILLTYLLSGFFVIFFLALVLTSVLSPISTYLQQHNINIIGASVLPLLLFCAIFAGISFTVFPHAKTQVSELGTLITSLEQQSFSSKMEINSKTLSFINSPKIDDLIGQNYHNALVHFLKSGFSFIVETLSSLPYLVILFFLVFFFLKDGDLIRRTLLHRVPNKYFEFAIISSTRVRQKLVHYLRSFFFLFLFTSLIYAFVFTLLGLPYSVLLGFLAGLGSTIPYLGVFITAIPIMFISTITLENTAIIFVLLGVFAGVHFSLTVIFHPILNSMRHSFHPVAVMLLLVLGYTIWAFWGVFFILPMATCVALCLDELSWGAQHFQFSKQEILY